MLLLLVRFEVLLVVTMQIAVWWDVLLYDLMQVCDTSGGPAASVIINKFRVCISVYLHTFK
jgi:hypothetical protein